MRQNKNIQLHQLHRKRCGKMTCIIGARCSDGVILISDRKITYEDKPSEYRDKLAHPTNYPIIVGGAGGSGTYEEFRRRIVPKFQPVLWKEMQVSGFINMYSDTENNFSNYQKRIIDVLREVNEEENYDANKVELLTGMQILGQESIFTYINSDGYPINGQQYRTIGTGAQYSYVFLKPFFVNEGEITMYKLARLGYFIIRFIEKFDIDPCHGVGGVPQFRCIPNNGPLFSDEDRPEWMSKFEKETKMMLENFQQKNIDALLSNG